MPGLLEISFRFLLESSLGCGLTIDCDQGFFCDNHACMPGTTNSPMKSISLSHFNYAYFVGCDSADQCPAGYSCDETSHTCILPPCEDNSYCELGPCDTQYGFNYTTCSFCLYGECQPGCQSDQSCPSGYVCDEDSHKCEAVSGKGLLGSINFRTSVPCSICSPEGVSAQLLGEKNALFPDGFPCNTSVLDHADTFDYGGSFGSWTSFDGTLNGSYSQEEVSMMGSCYEVISEIVCTVAIRSLTHKNFRHPSTIN